MSPRADSDVASSVVNLNAPQSVERSSTFPRLRSSVAGAHARTFAAVQRTAPAIPKEVNNWRTYLIAITICFGAAAYGYDTGFFGGTIALGSFRRDFGLEGKSSKEQDNISANLVSLFQGGSFFGAALQLPITQWLGRKWTINLSNIVFIASAFMQVFANGSIPLMMGGRFVGGLAIGISSLVIPLYLSEFAPPHIRGRLVGFYDIFIQIGTIFGFWANYIISKTTAPTKFQWQFPIAAQLFPAALLILAVFVPESPRFLVMKKKRTSATRALCRIRCLAPDHEYIRWELAQIEAQVEADEMIRGSDSTFTLFKQLLTSPGHRKRLLLAMSLLFFKTFSGVQAVNYYSPRIFQQLGFKGSQNSLFATGIYGTVKVVCTLIFGLFIVDRIGRRRPLMFGSTVGSLCLIFIGGYLTGVGPRAPDSGRLAGDYVAITAIFLYAAIYCFGYNSVPLTIISEIFTMRFREICMTICLMWQWLCTFAIVRIMPVSLTNITTRTYFVFGVIFFCATPFVWYFIPETKGLPLEAMDKLFGQVELTDVERAVLAADREKTASATSIPIDAEAPKIPDVPNAQSDILHTIPEHKGY